MKPGDLISRKYRLVRRVAEGGMGEIWAARNERTSRDVAIKFLLSSLARNPEAMTRFVQEARATGRLRHPGIIDLFDAGQSQGLPYLVMELLSGESLEARIARERRLSPLCAAVTLAQVARALSVAHRAGIVHRDLSSANVFLAREPGSAESVPKILDFGVSKVSAQDLSGKVRTGDGAVLGSPAFMSPEQARGAEGVDARSDLWSAGVLLYECVSGRLPFRAPNYNALMLAILNSPHVPIRERCPELSGALCEIVEDCLVKDREARIQSAEALAERLEHLAFELAGPEGAPVGLRRRATDRLSLAPLEARFTAVPPAARLPARTFPIGVRAWQLLSRGAAQRKVVAAGSALAGTAVGLALGVVVAGRELGRGAGAPATAEVAPSSPLDATRAHGPSVTPIEPGGADPLAGDLVEATARGLGIKVRHASPLPRSRPLSAPSAVAPSPPATAPSSPPRSTVAMRRNPYSPD